jgi:hypothetical protein
MESTQYVPVHFLLCNYLLVQVKFCANTLDAEESFTVYKYLEQNLEGLFTVQSKIFLRHFFSI